MEEILPVTHELKIWPAFFEAHISGVKPFELRRNDDQQFNAGDILWLREYFLPEDKYTGREMKCLVTYVTTGTGLEKGYCCMGVKYQASTKDSSTIVNKEGI